MRPFRNILVGIDLFAQKTLATRDITDASRQAVQQAIWLARQMDAHITFQAVLPSVLNPSSKYVPDWYASEFQLNVRQYHEDAASALQDLVNQAEGEKCIASAHLCCGDPWIELIRTAVEREHDLIVVGSRDEVGVSRLFIGSTAVKLIRKAPMAVWITHPRQKVEVRSVVAATDFSHTAERAAITAMTVANACCAELHLVHACHETIEARLWGGQRTPAQREEMYRAVCGEAQSQMEREITRLGAVDASFPVSGHVKWGHATEALLQVAMDQRADLLVMGSVGRTGLAGVLLGNTAERVLREIDRSLLVVKPEDFRCPVPLKTRNEPAHHP